MSGVLVTNCGIPPPLNCATCTPLSWADAVVPFAPLVAPVKVVDEPIAV